VADDFDLLVIGDVNPDVVVGPVPDRIEYGQREVLVPTGAIVLGGSAAITACGAARLGLRVAFAGRVGRDHAGAMVHEILAAAGVACFLTVDDDVATPLTTVLKRGSDRAILTAAGTLARTGADDVPPALLATSRHVHASSYFLMPELAQALPGLFRAAHRHGATTSLDTNDDPSGHWDIGDVLAVTDVLLPNAGEAIKLSRRATPREAAAALATDGRIVAVKNGADGALCHDGHELLECPAITVSTVDAVGAGDSFNAGFLTGLLLDLPPRRRLALAVACGALSTRATGGTAAQPTLAEALDHLPSYRTDQK
jgi:sugar/nucleoside kinase (ribokinase family)